MIRDFKSIIEKYSPLGICIIIGDINVSFSREQGMRCIGNRSANGNNFMTVIQSNGMYVVDTGPKGSGPTYTFTGGYGNSYLDHIIVPKEFESRVINCEVLPECV